MNIEISEKQAEYIRDANARWNVKMGATQSGKTFVDSRYIIPARLIERRGLEGVSFIVGVTKETIERNVLTKMRDLWGAGQVSCIDNRNRATLFGEQVYCVGAKDKSQVSAFRGATVKYLYVDEFPDISRDVFDIFASRLSLDYSVADLTGNPKDPRHWSEEFLQSDRDIYFQRYTLFDNPFLSKKTVEQIERDYRGTVFYHRYVLGLPKMAEGVVFPKFSADPTTWVIPVEAVPAYFRAVEVGFDIGGNGSAYALTATGQGFDGVQYRLKSEKRQAGEMTMDDIEDFVMTFCEDVERTYGVEIDAINCDHVAVVVNSLNDNTKYRACLCYKPPVPDRVFMYSKLLSNKKLLFASGKCDDLIDEMRGMVFDDRAADARPLDDGTMQIDCYDSACYSESSYWNNLEV